MTTRFFVALATLFVNAAVARGATFLVTNINDAGAGSLRSAIEQANATPGPDRIQRSACSPCVVAVASALPPITEGVSIYSVVVDGAGAGAVDGFVIDGPSVELSGVTVRNFSGDGVVIRGDGALLEFVTATGNRNGVRVEGQIAGIYGSDISSNEQNGVWLTPSSSENTIGRPDQECNITCIPFAGSNSISGNVGRGIWVEGDSNTIDSNIIGDAASPNGSGMLVTGAHNTVINSTVSYNIGAGIVLALPARFERNSGGCNGGPFISGVLIAPPTITSARVDPTVVTTAGEFHGASNTRYSVEVHQVSSCPATSGGLIGSATFTTDASGDGSWRAVFWSAPAVPAIFAMVNRPDAEETSSPSGVFPTTVTSEPNVDLSIGTTSPVRVAPNQEMEFVTVITNNGPAAISSFMVGIPWTSGTSYVSATTTSGNCWLGGLQFCQIDLLEPGQSATIRERVRVTAEEGAVLSHVARAEHWSGLGGLVTDPNPANNTASVMVVVDSRRRRTVRSSSDIPANSAPGHSQHPTRKLFGAPAE